MGVAIDTESECQDTEFGVAGGVDMELSFPFWVQHSPQCDRLRRSNHQNIQALEPVELIDKVISKYESGTELVVGLLEWRVGELSSHSRREEPTSAMAIRLGGSAVPGWRSSTVWRPTGAQLPAWNQETSLASRDLDRSISQPCDMILATRIASRACSQPSP